MRKYARALHRILKIKIFREDTFNMAEAENKIELDWDALEVGETFEKFEYLLTQEMIDTYREGVMDPEASFPTIAHKVDVRQYNDRYTDSGSVNARCAFHCYNPPRAGKKLTVTAWIADKYLSLIHI